MEETHETRNEISHQDQVEDEERIMMKLLVVWLSSDD